MAGWAFMVARCGLLGDGNSSIKGHTSPPTGDHKGPHLIHPTALTPTEFWAGAYSLNTLSTLAYLCSSLVILSAAKNLTRWTLRSFTTFRMALVDLLV